MDWQAPHIGLLPAGPRNAITDVAPLRVGHCTLSQGPIQTGVTVILPNADPFVRRPLAACCVLNGFGKSVGLMQVAELGCLETAIALTNTLSVGSVSTAQIRAALAAHPEIGRDWPTVNPLVLECNDGYLNDIQALVVGEEHFRAALAAAGEDFAQGAVGAGRGMSCFQLKGGIGSASRLVDCPAGTYILGALVLANFGKPEQCVLAGRPVGPILRERLAVFTAEQAGSGRAGSGRAGSGRAEKAGQAGEASSPEKGSIIMVLATDAPLDPAQLSRLARRGGNGLARTGSIFGHGSGDLVLAFSTAQSLPWPEPDGLLNFSRLPDSQIDSIFQAVADVTEQAILHALFHAESVVGRAGHVRPCLREILPDWQRMAFL